MDVTGCRQSRRLSIVLAICILCELCASDTDIITFSSRYTSTRYVGTAHTTQFASLEFSTAKFLGIAYAKPLRRFSKPVIATPRPGIVDANKFGNICPQIVNRWDSCHRHQTMSEECLFLNIYVPVHNISNQRLGVPVKSTTTPVMSSSEPPTSINTNLDLNGSLEVPPKSTDTASSHVSVSADSVSIGKSFASGNGSSDSEITVSSITTSLVQMDMHGNSSSSQLKPTHITEELWSTDKVTMKRSAPPVIALDKPLVLPADSKYAVFVYLHGGAYVHGSGNCLDGSVLAGHGDIIVVTINYRLGNLGFLSTDDHVIPGNLGLWDQHIAIRWVKKYIHLFGGDPDRITVGGFSAGSYSSLHQALFKGNDGLFQRVLAQSGTPTAAKSTSVSGYISTLEVAKQLNCDIEGTKQELKSCLMSKSAVSLINARPPMLVPGSLPIQPTVDETFVTEDPYTILSQVGQPAARKLPQVPRYFTSKDLLIGLTAQDGDISWRLHAALASSHDSRKMGQLLKSTINPEMFKTLIRMYFQKDFNDTIDEYILSSVLDRYMDWEHPKNDVSQSNRVIEFLTDVIFAIPVMDTATAHCHPKYHSLTNDQTAISEEQRQTTTERTNDKKAISEEMQLQTTTERTNDQKAIREEMQLQTTTESQMTPGQTFVYRFDLPRHTDNGIPWFRGTGHYSDLNYVFGGVNQKNEPDVALSKNMMTYWSNFVKFGNPNGVSTLSTAIKPTSEEALPVWREYDSDDENYLEISDNPESKSRMRASYRHFWNKYLPQLQEHMKEVYNEGKQSVIAESRLEQQSSGQILLESNIIFEMMLVAIGVTLMVI